MLNHDRKGLGRMHISRRLGLILSVLVVAALAIVTFAQADGTGRPSKREAHALVQRLSDQLAHMRTARSHHRSHLQTPRAAHVHSSGPRAHTAQVDAALKNAAAVAKAYALPLSPSSRNAQEVPATLPAQVVTEIQKPVVDNALDPRGADSDNSRYSSSDTESVVEVAGSFAAPTAPTPRGITTVASAPAKYLIVVTDDATGGVRGFGLNDTPIPLTQLSADVTEATVPRS